MQKKESVTKQHIQKADIVLIAVCLLSALLSGLWFMLGRQNGTMVSISYDKTLLYTIQMERSNDLDDPDTAQMKEQYCLIKYSDMESLPEITVTSSKPSCPSDSAYNLLCIAEGKIWMEEADCRDQICVRHKPISGNRESIICLPHKLVIELTSDSEDEVALDGMVK